MYIKKTILKDRNRPRVPPQRSRREIQPTPQPLKTPTIMDTVKEGFAFGVGASIASNVVKSVTGLFSSNEVKCENTKCSTLLERYEQCLKVTESCFDYKMDYEKCLKE